MQPDLSMELRFTDTYRQNSKMPTALRESACLRVQFPAILTEIRETDLFAGRIQYGKVGFSPQFGGFGYFCDEAAIVREMEKGNVPIGQRDAVLEMLQFWHKESTTHQIEAAFDERMAQSLCRDELYPFPFQLQPEIASPLYRMAGVYVNYAKLMRLGICGLRSEVICYLEKSRAANTDTSLYEGMLEALDLAVTACRYYREQALAQAANNKNSFRAEELRGMAAVLDRISQYPPETLREAIQLAWLYSILVGAMEFGRMDCYLGDFYVHDLETGMITEAEALAMVQSFWRLINDLIVEVDGRVVIGGRGRSNERNADRFALLAMEATRTQKAILPQLTLRFYTGMNPVVLDKALTLLGGGYTYPLLYNDDVLVESVAKAFDVPNDEAEQYCPLGCGEIILNHRSFATPSGAINLLKALEVTLHNGIDPVSGRQMGLKTGELASFNTFDKLLAAYEKQIAHFVEILADHEELEYRIMGENAPFLYMSMLYDDCMERGKGMFAGGVRYLDGTLETYGNVNAADSLTVIKSLVYDTQKLSGTQLLEILDRNFRGFDKERRMMMDCPKYGNDDAQADQMMLTVHNFVCSVIRNQRQRTTLHAYLAVIINNSMNTTLGRWVGASADGRKAGGAMANANTPAGGNDKKGVTALINSIVQPSTAIHAGSVQNMRFSRELFVRQRANFEAILSTYFKKGGGQAMITVINRGDLEKALLEPEKYKDVFVRVGGFSARFVDLPKDVQLEIISRNTY